jgi:hypothetical protein
MLRKISIERIRTRVIAIVNDDDPGAQIHRGKGDSAPGAARALTYISVELYDPQFVQRIRTP